MNINRRKFIETSLKATAIAAVYPTLTSFLVPGSKADLTISTIELFRYDITIPRYFSWGTWLNRQHLFMKISAGEHYGWSEIPASTNNPKFEISSWSGYLNRFKGMTVTDAYATMAIEQHEGGSMTHKQLEFLEMGLLDLLGKIQNKPSIELLDLSGRGAVPGLFCILDKDLKKVEENAKVSMNENLGSFMKIKMYGEKEVDTEIYQTVRNILGKEAMIMSDPNCGYKKWETIDELAIVLNHFAYVGLNAMEDPAKMTDEQWIELQRKAPGISLIPDEPLRPAWKGLENAQPGMGHIYNLHPSCMGSFSHVAKLANKVKDFGAKVMIGDDSLVGPACNAWQQIAIGTGAVWVEAIEKTGDSDNYLKCIVSKPTYRKSNGKFAAKLKPGFGLELDEKLLKSISADYLSL